MIRWVACWSDGRRWEVRRYGVDGSDTVGRIVLIGKIWQACCFSFGPELPDTLHATAKQAAEAVVLQLIDLGIVQ